MKRHSFLIFLLTAIHCLAIVEELQAQDNANVDSLFINQVVVTGSLKELKRDEFAIPVKIYDGEYFQRQQITNVQDAVRMITGIQANVDGALDGSGDIEINGQEGSYTLVLIDGIPLSGGNATVYAMSGIPMSIVDRIEVILGPSSTVYGTDAVAGVINIITKNPEKAPRLFVQGAINSYLESNVDLSFKLKVGKVQGLLAATNFNQSSRWDLNKDAYMDIPIQNRFSIFNKWAFRNKMQKVSTMWLRYTTDYRAGGEIDWRKKYAGGDYIYGEEIKTNRLEATGNLAMPIVEADLNLSYAYQFQNQQSFYGFFPFNSKEQNAFFQLVYDKKVAQKSELMTGVAYRFYLYETYSKTTRDTFANNKQQFVNHMPSFFLQDMIHLNKQNELLAGVRFEYTTANKGFAICPRIDYKWQSMNKKHSIRIGVGSGFRTPNLFLDDRLSYTQGKKVVFDDNLKNELAYGGHIYYELKKRKGNTTILFDGRVFANGVINNVEAEYDNLSAQYVIENEGNAIWYYGLQSNVELQLPSFFYLKTGFTFQLSYLIQKKPIIRTIPQLNAPALNTTFDIGYNNVKKGWLVSLNGWLNSPMLLRRQENDNRPAYSPWYSWVNLSVEKSFGTKFKVRIGANNLLNVLPKQIILRGQDPFNYSANDLKANPTGNRFDTSYIYAPNKGIHGFLSFLYLLP